MPQPRGLQGAGEGEGGGGRGGGGTPVAGPTNDAREAEAR